MDWLKDLLEQHAETYVIWSVLFLILGDMDGPPWRIAVYVLGAVSWIALVVLLAFGGGELSIVFGGS